MTKWNGISSFLYWIARLKSWYGFRWMWSGLPWFHTPSKFTDSERHKHCPKIFHLGYLFEGECSWYFRPSAFLIYLLPFQIINYYRKYIWISKTPPFLQTTPLNNNQARVAQSAERSAVNRKVGGSNPPVSDFLFQYKKFKSFSAITVGLRLSRRFLWHQLNVWICECVSILFSPFYSISTF